MVKDRRKGTRNLGEMMDSVAEVSQLAPVTKTTSQAAANDETASSGSSRSKSAAKQSTKTTKDKPPKSSTSQAETAARKQRDKEFASVLAERYGVDPTSFGAPAGRTKGSTYRPTIELSPDERAGITAAQALRPDLFSSMADFVRHFALHWQEYLDPEQTVED